MYQEIPLISVIVPVYGAEKELPRCVESLLAQSHKNLEIILVEDGSPDSSGAICDRYAAADKRVRAIHQPNAGASAARNNGIETATGDFLCFVDADDEVEPNYIRDFVQGLAPEVDLVFQGICEIREGKSTRKIPPLQFFCQGELTQAIALINRQSMFGYVCNKLYRRSIIMEHGLRFRRDIRLSEDRLFALEYMRYARGIQLVAACNYRYYQQTSGQMMRHRSYEEFQEAADANLQAALGLLEQQPCAQFLRDTHRMFVMSSLYALTALFVDGAPLLRCTRAFRTFINTARDWLPLYRPTTRDHQALLLALRCPAPLGVGIMKLYWCLKQLKHEISA